MGGNHSRYSHQKAKRYSALNLVQGAMVTDADQMESQTLGVRNTQHLGQRSIGSGVPKTAGILQYTHDPGITGLRRVTGLKNGFVVANGRTADLRPAPGQVIPAGNGMQLVALQGDLIGGPALPTDAARYMLFADVWDRHCGPAEDARFSDAAFLSAETSVRKERVAQLKFATIASGVPDVGLRGLAQNPASLPNFGDLRLTAVTFGATVVQVDECDPCAGELTETNLETGNDLFRFEIHASDFNVPRLAAVNSTTFQPTQLASQTLTVKWSRDNGGLEVPATARAALLADSSFDNSVFELADLPGEQRLGLYSAGTQRVSRLLRKADLAAEPANSLTGKIIRVWEGAARIDLNVPTLAPVPVGVATLTGNVVRSGAQWQLQIKVSDLELVFSASPRAATLPFILPGDAYCVEVREFASGPNGRLIFQAEPVEVHHDYVFLGQISGGAFINPALPDTRAVAFPALTEITADDVSWSNRNHVTVNANTVQSAIDLLFAREVVVDEDDCQCTFLIDPDKDLFEQLELIQQDMQEIGLTSALICFPVGTWELSKPFEFKGHATLILKGCGFGSRITAKFGMQQSMLSFFEVGNVTIEDIDIENQAPDAAGCVVFTKVRQTRLYRARFAIDGREDKDQFAVLAMRPTGGANFPPLFEADSCLFLVGSSNTGLIVDGSFRFVVSNCQFSAPLDLQGKFGKGIKWREDLIRFGKVVLVTKKQIDLDPKRYIVIKYIPRGTALDLDGIDEDDRRVVAGFWEQSLAIVAPDGLTSPEEFEIARNDLTLLNWGLKMAGGLAFDQLEEPGADPNKLVLGGGEFKLLRSASGFGDGDNGLLGEIRMDKRADAGVPLSPRIMAMVNAAAPPRPGIAEPMEVFTARPMVGVPGVPGLPGTLPPPPGPDDGPGLPQVNPIKIELIDIEHTLEAHIKDRYRKEWLDKFGDIEVVPIKPDQIDKSPVSFGIEAILHEDVDTQIIRNRFSGIDVAIRINGDGKQKRGTLDDPPERTLIRDNVVVRAPRQGLDEAKEFRFPITVADCGNVIIEHNTVQQLPDSTVDPNFFEHLYSFELDQRDRRFAAIGIVGNTGNQLRVIGNTALLYRHCVVVDAGPRSPGSEPGSQVGRPNYWVLQHNTVAPNFESEKYGNWAVRIENQVNLVKVVVLLRGPNHPEPPPGQS